MRFVSSFIADTLTGISRGFDFMGVFYSPMPSSGNNKVEYHAHNGYWKCCLSNKPEPQLKDRLRRAEWPLHLSYLVAVGERNIRARYAQDSGGRS